MSLREAEAEKYRKIWDFPEYSVNSPGQRCVPAAIDALRMERGDTVIDFGCGTGRAVKEFMLRGMVAYGFDIAPNAVSEDITFIQGCLWDMPEIEAEYGFCADVMEHIPPEKVEDTLKGIAERVNKCFFNICLIDDGYGPKLLDEPLHLTVNPAPWWQKELEKHFESVRIGRNMPHHAELTCE